MDKGRVCGVALNQNAKTERDFNYSDPGHERGMEIIGNKGMKGKKVKKKEKEKSGFRTIGLVDNFYCLTRNQGSHRFYLSNMIWAFN